MLRLALVGVFLVGAGTPVTPPQTDPRALLAAADRLLEESTRVSLDASIEAFAKAAAAAREAGLREVQARALLGQGIALSLLARNAEAAPPLDQAEPIFAALGDRSGLAETRLYRASLRDGPNDSAEVIATYRASIALAREAGDRRVEALGLDFLGWANLPTQEKRAAFEEAVAIRRTLPSKWDLATSLCGLAYATGNVRERRPILGEAIAIAEPARALRPLGFALSQLVRLQGDDFEKGLEYYYRAQVLNRESGNRTQEAFTLEVRAGLHRDHGQLREAIDYYTQAMAAHAALKKRQPEGYLRFSIAAALRGLGEVDAADEQLERALAVVRELRDVVSEGGTLVGMSAARRDAGDALGALQHAQAALVAYKSVGVEDRQIAAYDWMGAALVALGRYREAIDAYRAAHDIATRHAINLQIAAADRSLGTTFALIGDAPRAIDHLSRAREMAIKAGNSDLVAVVLVHLASVRLTLGEPDVAKALLDEAAAIAEKSQRVIVEVRVLDVQARHALATHQPERALALLEQSAARKRRAGELNTAPYNAIDIARAHLLGGNRTAAADTLRRALAESRTMRNPGAESMALTELMNLARVTGDAAAAVFYGKQAVNMFQATRADLQQLDLATQRAYVNSRAQVYRDLADILIESGRLMEAQQVLNLLKDQEFFDFIRREGPTTSTGAVALTPREAAVLEEYQRNAARLAGLGRKRGELLLRRNRTAEEEREFDDLDAELRVAETAFTQFIAGLAAELSHSARGAVQIAEIKNTQAFMEDLRELKHNAVVLYTVVHPERYRVLLVTPDVRVDAYYPIPATALNRKVLAFRQALEDPGSNPQPLAQELYEILVAPIAPALEKAKAKTLMWVLDGTLRYLPVAALHDGRGYLAERYLNTVFTPASHARLKDEPSRRWTGLGAGVSKPHGDFSPLPAVTDELRGIFRTGSQSAGVLDGQILLDEAFTADAFRRGLRQRRPLVHVATHFQFNPGNETDSFLLLGDGSRMTLAEMRQSTGLFGGVELLTLSACNTAVGDAGATGTEVEGAGILAQNNGAKAVIASLWSVSDASTRVFMQEFYRARNRRGGTKASALRDAQVALLRGGAASTTGDRRGLKAVASPSSGQSAQYSHPYYWAPFILIGNWK
jgi:CHAT domain-containing protein